MLKRTICLFLSLLLICGVLSGCGVSFDKEEQEALEVLKNTAPMKPEEVVNTRLVATTNEERESAMYKYIIDRIVVDPALLLKVSSADEKNINTLFTNINHQLEGKEYQNGANPLIDEYANYLLLEFSRTPYEWEESNKNILGFDPSARLYFVDVTYRTTSAKKNIVPDSKIPLGHPDAEAMQKKRYNDYIAISKMRYDNSLTGYTSANYEEKVKEFNDTWGPEEDIFREQQGVSLYERTKELRKENSGIGLLTYSGLQSLGDKTFSKGAVMTIRYVLKYDLNLGEETEMVVDALYMKDYKLDEVSDIIANYKYDDTASIEVLSPFIDQLIWSYNKCVEESNFDGLYSLHEDFSTIDKYYEGIRDYTYNSIGGYTYDVIKREGHTVTVKVSRTNQIRARGAEMSLPTYDETLLFILELGRNDKILIKNIYLLERTMIGEPLSVIRNVAGISEKIQFSTVAFSEANRAAVIETLKKFTQLITNGDYSSSDYVAVVDLGVSQNVLNKISSSIKSIVPVKTASYIINWDSATNVYCNLTLRQVFECENGNYDTEAQVSLGNRNGTWKVVNYTRTVNIKSNKAITEGQDTENQWFQVRTTEGETTKVSNIIAPVVEENKGDLVEHTGQSDIGTPSIPSGETSENPSSTGEDLGGIVETPSETVSPVETLPEPSTGGNNSGDFD